MFPKNGDEKPLLSVKVIVFKVLEKSDIVESTLENRGSLDFIRVPSLFVATMFIVISPVVPTVRVLALLVNVTVPVVVTFERADKGAICTIGSIY